MALGGSRRAGVDTEYIREAPAPRGREDALRLVIVGAQAGRHN